MPTAAPACRPLLAVPHILADESSAYYHGYVLAEMSVHQTREYFKSKYGSIADNPEVGKQLTDVRPCPLSPISLEAWGQLCLDPLHAFKP